MSRLVGAGFVIPSIGLALLWASPASAQEAAMLPERASPFRQSTQGVPGIIRVGFELGLGVGATGVDCAAPCNRANHLSAGPLLVFGTLVHPKIFVGGQIVGSALDDDRDTELALWGIMPLVKYYPTRSVYIGVGAGIGKAEGRIDGDRIDRAIWSAETRAAWTLPWNRAITPFVSYFRPFSELQLDTPAGQRRARTQSFQLGVALSTPGGPPD